MDSRLGQLSISTKIVQMLQTVVTWKTNNHNWNISTELQLLSFSAAVMFYSSKALTVALMASWSWQSDRDDVGNRWMSHFPTRPDSV